MERAERIREARLHQPIEELKRKADKSRERANLYSQEEIDLADAEARELVAYFARIKEEVA